MKTQSLCIFRMTQHCASMWSRASRSCQNLQTSKATGDRSNDGQRCTVERPRNGHKGNSNSEARFGGLFYLLRLCFGFSRRFFSLASFFSSSSLDTERICLSALSILSRSVLPGTFGAGSGFISRIYTLSFPVTFAQETVQYYPLSLSFPQTYRFSQHERYCFSWTVGHTICGGRRDFRPICKTGVAK